jgi:hypothetical protein
MYILQLLNEFHYRLFPILHHPPVGMLRIGKRRYRLFPILSTVLRGCAEWQIPYKNKHPFHGYFYRFKGVSIAAWVANIGAPVLGFNLIGFIGIYWLSLAFIGNWKIGSGRGSRKWENRQKKDSATWPAEGLGWIAELPFFLKSFKIPQTTGDF